MIKSEYKNVSILKKNSKINLVKAKRSDPLLIVFTPKKDPANKTFHQLLEGLLFLQSHVVIIGEDMPNVKNSAFNEKFTFVKNENVSLVKKYVIGADMAIIFENNSQIVKKLMDNGVVIIGNSNITQLKNYDSNKETGNSFTFKSMNAWAIFRALVRARETYTFPYDWQHIVKAVLV